MKHILGLVCGVIGCLGLFGQTPVHQHISDVDGLPSMQIYDLFLDSKGKLWLGTEEGVFSYDGFEFTPYSLSKARSTAVTNICEVDSGRLLFHNFSGQTFLLRNDTVSLFGLKTMDGVLYDIQEYDKSNNGLFYFLAQQKVYRGKNPLKDTFSLRYPTQNTDHKVRSLNAVWNDSLFTERNIVIDLERGEEYPSSYSGRVLGLFGGKRIHFDFKNSPNIQWGSNRESLNIFDDGRPTTINKVYHENDTTVWLCTRDGLSRIQLNGTYKTWLSGIIVTDMLSDLDGNYWVSTLHNGLYKIPKRGPIWVMDTVSSFLNQHITQVSWYSDSLFFVGTQNGKLWQGSSEHQVNLVFDSHFKEPIKAISALPKGYAVVGNEVFFLDKDFALIKYRYSAAKKTVPIDGDKLAVACGNEGAIINVSSYQHIALRSRRARTTEYFKNKVFMGYDDSLMVYDTLGNQIEALTTPKGSIVASAMVASDSALWIASFNQGILRYQGDSVVMMIKPHELPRGVKLHLHNGALYIATGKGLYEYSTHLKKLRNMSTLLQLPRGAITGVSRSGDKLLIGMRQGLIYCNLQSTDDIRPQIETSERFQVTSGLASVYSMDTEGLTIDYDYWNYTSNRYDSVYFRLNDGTWKSKAALPSTFTFPTPKTGRHRIQLAYKPTSSAVWYETTFEIQPPYYQSIWFRLTVVLLLFSTVILYFLWRIRKQRIKNAQALRLAQSEKDRQLSQLVALRSQMNPHFLFNVLNSIQDFILQNEKGAANKYLGKFADVVRNTLSLSSKELIGIDEELRNLDNYISLEALRFEDSINYTLEVQPGLDLSFYSIPPLLIQPFVENAIKHGLMPSHQVKKLRIRLMESERKLLIEIEDNGVGIQSKTKEEEKAKHESFAISASKSRLELLSHLFQREISIEIHSPVANERGTRVRIYLPILTPK